MTCWCITEYVDICVPLSGWSHQWKTHPKATQASATENGSTRSLTTWPVCYRLSRVSYQSLTSYPSSDWQSVTWGPRATSKVSLSTQSFCQVFLFSNYVLLLARDHPLHVDMHTHACIPAPLHACAHIHVCNHACMHQNNVSTLLGVCIQIIIVAVFTISSVELIHCHYI